MAFLRNVADDLRNAQEKNIFKASLVMRSRFLVDCGSIWGGWKLQKSTNLSPLQLRKPRPYLPTTWTLLSDSILSLKSLITLIMSASRASLGLRWVAHERPPPLQWKCPLVLNTVPLKHCSYWTEISQPVSYPKAGLQVMEGRTLRMPQA